jgi:hypothetical protein
MIRSWRERDPLVLPERMPAEMAIEGRRWPTKQQITCQLG